MVKKKVAVKKKPKSVLDYDPLARLGEEQTVPELETVKAQENQSVAEESIQKETTITGNEATTMSNANEENPGYGFFDDTPESEEIIIQAEEPETQSEQELGYGFFDTGEPLTTQAVELDVSTNVINLGAELTIQSVSDCKALIDQNLMNGFDIKLAAGELQKIDSAGLQLIFSLNRRLQKTSQSITWVSSNSIINDAAKLIGMPELLEISDEEQAYGFFNEELKADNNAAQQEESAFGFF